MSEHATPQADMVNHPSHYTFADPAYEVLKVIEAWKLGYHLGNVVKYVARAGRKGKQIEDLRKARFYLDRYIQKLEDEVRADVAKRLGGR